MTTIVYRQGIMVGDSRAYSGGISPIGVKRKVRRLFDGTLLGVTARTPGLGELLFKWYEEGKDPHYQLPAGGREAHSYTLLAVEPSGLGYFSNDSLILSGPLESEYFAIGSGDGYALGAMAMGASALKAAEVAAGLDPWSAPPFHSITHEG